jgi:hypothetical protein
MILPSEQNQFNTQNANNQYGLVFGFRKPLQPHHQLTQIPIPLLTRFLLPPKIHNISLEPRKSFTTYKFTNFPGVEVGQQARVQGTDFACPQRYERGN